MRLITHKSIGSCARRLLASTPCYILRVAASFARQNLGSLGGADVELGGTLAALAAPSEAAAVGLGASIASWAALVLLSWRSW